MGPSLVFNGMTITNHVIPLVFSNIPVVWGGRDLLIKMYDGNTEIISNVTFKHTCKYGDLGDKNHTVHMVFVYISH